MNPKHLAMTAAAVVSATAILTLLWLLSLPSPPVTAGAVTTAAPRYVSLTGTDSGDCIDSTSPCRTVQYAVDQADEGSVIKVASGVYADMHMRHRNDITSTGFVAQVVYISKTVTIRGGYTVTNWAESDPDANSTVLDAQGQGRVLYITAPAPGAGISPTIEGLRITGGDSAELGGGLGWNTDAGGGIYIITATVTLSGCRVFTNTADGSDALGRNGGGVYLINSPNATLIGNVIRGNDAEFGGGIYLLASGSAILSGNTIQDNVAAGWYGAGGGGIALRDSPNATLSSNSILSNTAQAGGGVLVDYSDNVSLRGNTILSNTAMARLFSEGGGILLRGSGNVALNGNIIQSNLGGFGSGVSIWDSETITLDNNVIADNYTWWDGSGVFIAGSSAYLRHTTLARNGGGSGLHITDGWGGGAYSTVALTNTILVSHTVGITVTAGNTVTLNGILWYENEANTGGLGTLTVSHQITGNPAFAADGYHITSPSAAANAGVDSEVAIDIDGDPRPAGTSYDLGADELLAVLRVTKQANPTPAESGARLTYTIRITNTGSVDLHATITDTLPISVVLGKTSGSTLLPLGGMTRIIWTATITAPNGIWTETVVVTVAEDYQGPLTNLVEVTTEEGARDVYTEISTVVSDHSIYLPLVLKSWPSMMPVSGRVTLEDGTGLAGVEVYIGNPCSHPLSVWLAATTDSEGYYAADTHCPFDHDETLRVFAVFDGYTFAPEFECWRTYGYCAGKHTDFVAFPAYTGTATVEQAILGLGAVNDSPTPLGNTTMFTANVAAGSNVALAWGFGDGGQVDMGVISAGATYPLTNTEWTRLTTNSWDDWEPTWSPDGVRIAWVRKSNDWNRNIWEMKAEDGSDQLPLTDGSVEESSDYSPDGRKLVYVQYHSDSRADILIKDLGNGVITVTRSTGYNGHPRWSPDGTKILYHSASSTEGSYHIYTMTVNGSNVTQLTSDGWMNRWPDWSPDGSRIVFASDRIGSTRDQEGHIYVMDADGGNVVLITNGADQDSRPTWSRSGRYIAFGRKVPGYGGHIYVMKDDGTNITQITDSDTDERQAAWSPDDSKIAFSAEANGNRDIYVANFSVPAVVTHTYPMTGAYTAVVTAINSVSQLTATTTVTITDAGDPPVAGGHASQNVRTMTIVELYRGAGPTGTRCPHLTRLLRCAAFAPSARRCVGVPLISRPVSLITPQTSQ